MITPVDKPIVAISSLSLVHEPPNVVLSNIAVPLEHISCVPLKVPVFGAAVIMTVRVAVALGQASSPATV